MKNNMEKHPDTISGEAFIYEHGYKLVIEGRYYDPDFAKVKLFLSSLDSVPDLRVFINKVKTDEAFAQTIVKDLIDLWQADFDLRPATGILLLAVLWDKLNLARRKDFVTFCGDIFFVLAGTKKSKRSKIEPFSIIGHEDIIADLLEEANRY
jgi:hypothetical protein